MFVSSRKYMRFSHWLFPKSCDRLHEKVTARGPHLSDLWVMYQLNWTHYTAGIPTGTLHFRSYNGRNSGPSLCVLYRRLRDVIIHNVLLPVRIGNESRYPGATPGWDTYRAGETWRKHHLRIHLRVELSGQGIKWWVTHIIYYYFMLRHTTVTVIQFVMLDYMFRPNCSSSWNKLSFTVHILQL
jgi:hypothetical protein